MVDEAASVKVVMLSSGLELIGGVVSDDGVSISLDKVLIVVVDVDDKTKRLALNFAPFSPLTADVKTFSRSSVVMVTEPRDGLRNAYAQATGRVVIPNKEVILG